MREYEPQSPFKGNARVADYCGAGTGLILVGLCYHRIIGGLEGVHKSPALIVVELYDLHPTCILLTILQNRLPGIILLNRHSYASRDRYRLFPGYIYSLISLDKHVINVHNNWIAGTDDEMHAARVGTKIAHIEPYWLNITIMKTVALLGDHGSIFP